MYEVHGSDTEAEEVMVVTTAGNEGNSCHEVDVSTRVSRGLYIE